MRVTIVFLLKSSKARPGGNCPIYVRVTLRKKRFELSTGLFIDPESWGAEKQRIMGRSSEVRSVNNRISKVYNSILDACYQLGTVKKDFDINDLKSLVSRLNIKSFFDKIDNQSFVVFFVA